MKICYIWAEEFKSARDFSVNLSSRHIYSFNSDLNEINRSKKDDYPSNIFGESVNELTGLLGVNGSGKTMALEFICHCIKDNHKFRKGFVIIYEKDCELRVFSSVKNLTANSFQLIQAKNADDLKELNVVFFSNVYDGNYIEFSDEIIDLSTNSNFNPRRVYRDRLKNEESPVEKQVRFLYSKVKEEIEFPSPRQIEYKINRTVKDTLRAGRLKRSPRSNGVFFSSVSEDTLLWLHALFVSEVRSVNRRDYLELTLLLTRQHFISVLVNPSHEVTYEPDFFCEILNKAKGRSTKEILSIILQELDDDLISHWFSTNHTVKDLAYFLLEDIDNAFYNLEFKEIESLRGSRINFSLQFKNNSEKIHQKLICIYESFLGGSANWANVSSGQKAYLNMYALIWAEVEKVISTNKKQDFIICIDEGDLYLHPQWQVSFVKDLVKYLPVIFSGCVQIVLTTHSPLLVSDIPMQCINMLSRNVLDQTTLNFLKDGNTFGANIYDIYSGVFGLGEERKSSLSNSYIDNVMLILRKEALSDSDRNKLSSSLKLIGDDLIRFHIKKRLNKID